MVRQRKKDRMNIIGVEVDVSIVPDGVDTI